MKNKPELKTWSIYFFCALYITAGVLHFIKPEFYLKIMPQYIPWHLTMVYLSGIIEIILGVALIYKKNKKMGCLWNYCFINCCFSCKFIHGI